MQQDHSKYEQGKEAGPEAAIHAIYNLHQQDKTDAVFLVGADNPSILSTGKRCFIISLSTAL